MSVLIHKSKLKPQEIAQIYKESKVKKIPKQNSSRRQYPEIYKLYEFHGGVLWLPKTIGVKYGGVPFYRYIGRHLHKRYWTSQVKLFTKETDTREFEKRDQNIVLQNTLNILKTKNRALIDVSCGYGKSKIIIRLAEELCLKTLVTVVQTDLQKDLYQDFKKLTDANVVWFRGSKEPNVETDVDIIGTGKASNLSREFLSRYDCIIIDEVEQTFSKQRLNLLKRSAPKYMIGLSGSMFRQDGLDKCFHKYWDEDLPKIKRFETKQHVQVIKYQTNYKPILEFRENGTMKNEVFDLSLAKNKDRQKSIERLVRKLYDDGHHILILCKRIVSILSLYNLLKDLSTDYRCGKPSNKDYDYENGARPKKDIDTNKRILIQNFASSGRGFDRPGLTCVIFVNSYSNVIQYEGRLRAEKGLIYDIVDNHPILENRFRSRVTWYNKRKIQIKFQIDGQDEIKEIPKRVSKKQTKKTNMLSNLEF